MFTRYRMHKIIKLLENPEDEFGENVRGLCSSPRYLKALKALSAKGYVKCVYADDEPIPARIFAGEYAPVYLLEREELWFNRIVSFILGVLTAIAASALPLLLQPLQ